MSANGVGVPTQITLSGTGVTLVSGSAASNNGQNTYQVTLALGGTATVAVTAAAKDVAFNTGNYSGAFNWLSYNTAQATVGAATGNPITITAVAKGQAIVEISVPFGDSDGTDALLAGKVYALLQVNVNA